MMPEHLALPHVEIDVVQCPEFFQRVALDDLATAQHVNGLARYVLHFLADDIAKRDVAVLAQYVASDVRRSSASKDASQR